MSRALLAEFADAVSRGLAERPKHLPPAWLLDEAGARLRAAASSQPECYVERTEHALLAAHAAAMLPPAGPVAVVELGVGAPERTRLFLDAVRRREGRVALHPIDVRGDALRDVARRLQGQPGLRVRPVQGHAAPSLRALPREGPRLVLVLGPRMAQLGPAEGARFLADLRGGLAAGDALLVTTPLPREPEALVRAHDDRAGAMAAFHANVLARINRELGGQFDLARFRYEAAWDAAARCVRMSLVSEAEQEVRVRAARRSFRFAAGEPLHVEDAHAFTPEDALMMAQGAGLRVEQGWQDPEGRVAVHRLGVRPVPPAA